MSASGLPFRLTTMICGSGGRWPKCEPDWSDEKDSVVAVHAAARRCTRRCSDRVAPHWSRQ